jgi:hypothetical protein
MTKRYCYAAGVFTFPAETCSVRLSRVERNRFGSLFADVAILTPEGAGYLAQDHGELSSERFRANVAAAAAKRNAGNNLALEGVLLECYLAVKDDPAVASAITLPAFVPAIEFMRRSLPDLPELVNGLIAPGRLYVIAAKPKSGKTILLLNIALAVAGGRDVLGRSTTRGRVAFFQLEDSERTLQRRLSLMCPAGVPPDLLLHLAPFRLAQENFVLTLAAVKGCSLVICDPIICATEIRDWNAQDEVRKGYDLWRRLSRETDAAVIVSAHHRKQEGEYGDALAGSIQGQASVDGMIELYRSQSLDRTERRVSYLGRDWGDIPDEVLRLNTDALLWEPMGSYEEAVTEAKQGKAEATAQAIFEALPTSPPGLTYEEVEKVSSYKHGTIAAAFKLLGDKVKTTGKSGSKVNPIRFYRGE